jgi:hypothetical protein
MGVVYLGEARGGQRVAIKVIRPEYADDPGFRSRFRREVEAAARVGGACTARVLTADVEAPAPYLVTEYVPGPTLAEHVEERGPLPPPQLRALALGLAEALTAIHRAGIVHRDLKPSNVLLAPDGPRVIDFGIARAMDQTAVTRSGTWVGTPAWTAPEQVRGEAAGPPADVFAWGALVAFAGTGRRPFQAETPEGVIHRILHEVPDLEGLEPSLRGLVQEAMSKDPASRPSAVQLVRAIAGDETIGEDEAGVETTVKTALARMWDADLAGSANTYRSSANASPRRTVVVAASLLATIAAAGVGLALATNHPAGGGGEAETVTATIASPSLAPGLSESPTSAGEQLGATAMGAGTTTSERIFDAFTAAGNLAPSFAVERTAKGSCVPSFIGRPDAWRCFTSSLIYDPCFQPPRVSEVVVCDLTPWDRVGVRVQLRSSLPWPESVSRTDWLQKPPWAVELVDGTRCLLILGGAGRDMVGGEAVNYTCEPAGGLWGEPDSSTDPWTAYFTSDVGEPEKVEVRAVWH